MIQEPLNILTAFELKSPKSTAFPVIAMVI